MAFSAFPEAPHLLHKCLPVEKRKKYSLSFLNNEAVIPRQYCQLLNSGRIPNRFPKEHLSPSSSEPEMACVDTADGWVLQPGWRDSTVTEGPSVAPASSSMDLFPPTARNINEKVLLRYVACNCKIMMISSTKNSPTRLHLPAVSCYKPRFIGTWLLLLPERSSLLLE